MYQYLLAGKSLDRVFEVREFARPWTLASAILIALTPTLGVAQQLQLVCTPIKGNEQAVGIVADLEHRVFRVDEFEGATTNWSEVNESKINFRLLLSPGLEVVWNINRMNGDGWSMHLIDGESIGITSTFYKCSRGVPPPRQKPHPLF